MKPILQLLFCLIFTTCIWSASIGQIDQHTSQPQVSSEKIDWSNYKEKMGFSDEIEFTPTGHVEKDRQAYQKLIEIRKIMNAENHTAMQRPGNSGRSTPPSNDQCAEATMVECGWMVSGTTVDATFDGAPFCGTFNTAPGVWYSLTPDENAFVTVSTCNQADYDTRINVYTGGCGVLSCVAGQDDNIAECGFDFTTKLNFNAIANQEYLILVHGFDIITGNFDLSITCRVPPSNDDVCNAKNIDAGSETPFENTSASAQAGEPSPGTGSEPSSCESQDGWCSFETDVDNSIWYSFMAPASGCVTIVADGFDTQLALWEAEQCFDFGSFTKVAANDNSGDNVIPEAADLAAGIIEACVTPDETYWIQLDGYNGAEGTGTLHLIDCGGDPLTVDAGGCQSRFLGYGPAEKEINYLCAEVSGGVPPYSFSWTPEGDILETNGECIAVQPDVTTTYTVEVTDARGCEVVSDEVTVNVINISTPCPGNKKVQICHVPRGNPENEHNICINKNAVRAHLNNHDDRLGPCDNICLETNENPFPEDAQRIGRESIIPVVVFPNPFNQTTTIKFEVPEDTHTTIDIFSSSGAKVATIFDAFVEAGAETSVQFDGYNKGKGLYYYVIRTENGNLAQGKMALIE